MPVLVWDFAFLLVRLNKHPSITYKMGIPFGQDCLHCLRIDKSNEPKHPLLLVGNPHVLHWPINTSTTKTGNYWATNFSSTKFQLCTKPRTQINQSEHEPEIVWHIFLSKSTISWESQVDLPWSRVNQIVSIKPRSTKFVHIFTHHQSSGSPVKNFSKQLAQCKQLPQNNNKEEEDKISTSGSHFAAVEEKSSCS